MEQAVWRRCQSFLDTAQVGDSGHAFKSDHWIPARALTMCPVCPQTKIVKVPQALTMSLRFGFFFALFVPIHLASLFLCNYTYTPVFLFFRVLSVFMSCRFTPFLLHAHLL